MQQVEHRIRNVKFQKHEITQNQTLVDGLDEGLDVPFLAEDDRNRSGIGIGIARALGRVWIRVNRDSRGIVSAVLQTPQTIEQNLQYVSPLPVHLVIQIRKYPTHFLSSPLFPFFFSLLLLSPFFLCLFVCLG